MFALLLHHLAPLTDHVGDFASCLINFNPYGWKMWWLISLSRAVTTYQLSSFKFCLPSLSIHDNLCQCRFAPILLFYLRLLTSTYLPIKGVYHLEKKHLLFAHSRSFDAPWCSTIAALPVDFTPFRLYSRVIRHPGTRPAFDIFKTFLVI